MAKSYNFTKDFFFTKLRRSLRRPASRPYRRRTAFGLEWLGFMSGRYLSSSTLVIQPLDYDLGARITPDNAATREAEKPVVELAGRLHRSAGRYYTRVRKYEIGSAVCRARD